MRIMYLMFALLITMNIFIIANTNESNVIVNSSLTLARNQPKFNIENTFLKLNNPKDATNKSLIFDGGIIISTQTDSDFEKEVIVEFTQTPVRTFRGQMNFNHADVNRSIELVYFQHNRFIADLERITKNVELQNAFSFEQADYSIKFRYRIAINGMSIRTKQWVIDELTKLDYVKAIHDVVEVSINDDLSNQVIRVDSVWANFGVTGEGMLISIIDTGIDSNHVTLNNGKVIGGHNFVNNTKNFLTTMVMERIAQVLLLQMETD